MSFLTQALAGIQALTGGPLWDHSALLRFQNRRLKSVVKHAYSRIPFYREHLQSAGVTPENIQGLKDLRRIPFTSRNLMQLFSDEDFVAQGLEASHLVTCSTSGSTGEPLRVSRTGFEETLVTLLRLRALLHLGLRPWQRIARVAYYGQAVTQSAGPWSSVRSRLEISKKGRIHCQAPPGEILDRLLEVKPHVLRGYPTILTSVSEIITDSESKLLKLELVITGAEIVTAEIRRQLEEGYQSTVLDLYGAHEFPLIAYECKHSGAYHLCEEALIAEVLKGEVAAGPGEAGELVLTGLHSFAMPFIRYRTGDRVVLGECPCPCGAPYATLDSIQGRMLDLFYFPDGTIIDASIIDQNLRRLAPWVRRYQVVQKNLASVTIKTVAWKVPDSETIADTARKLKQELRDETEVIFEFCDELPLGPAGKFRLYESKLKPQDSKVPESS